MRQRKARKNIRCAVVGYGAAFNMGRAHAGWMKDTPGLEPVAVCDTDPTRLEAAKDDFPGIETYESVGEMLRQADFDLAAIVTPHNTHAPLTIKCLKARKHVVVEKPMCITVREATAMIEAAKESKVMLSTFHNRRHDGDYKAIREVIQKGLIGDVFHVEVFGGGYGHPGYWWRGDKAISGGALYDWGAHLVDWVLGLVPGKVSKVIGFFHKRVWHDVTNEDQVQALIHFESGAVADVQLSSIARVGKPRWRILGTKGGILDQGGGSVRVNTEVDGLPVEMEVKYKESDWEAYYINIANHLLRGEPLEVTPESSRRVIAIMEAAGKSAKSRRPTTVPYE